jgi:hypothetical protein
MPAASIRELYGHERPSLQDLRDLARLAREAAGFSTEGGRATDRQLVELAASLEAEVAALERKSPGGAGAGTLYGTSQSQTSNLSFQQRYNIAYEQCMYSKGNQVPGYAPASPSNYPPLPALS